MKSMSSISSRTYGEEFVTTKNVSNVRMTANNHLE